MFSEGQKWDLQMYIIIINANIYLTEKDPADFKFPYEVKHTKYPYNKLNNKNSINKKILLSKCNQK